MNAAVAEGDVQAIEPGAVALVEVVLPSRGVEVLGEDGGLGDVEAQGRVPLREVDGARHRLGAQRA